jgi:hypothetical protein
LYLGLASCYFSGERGVEERGQSGYLVEESEERGQSGYFTLEGCKGCLRRVKRGRSGIVRLPTNRLLKKARIKHKLLERQNREFGCATTSGVSPPSSIRARLSHRAAFSLLPKVSSASVWTRSNLTALSDSSTVRGCCLSARCRRVRCGMTNFSISWSLNPADARPFNALKGSRLRTAVARSACKRTSSPRTEAPPSLRAISRTVPLARPMLPWLVTATYHENRWHTAGP